ncbi:MAG: class I SAM-dependent methyltransferase [Bdellovibrionales bacterium]|nr:class I SAM-dependent methyltransferase [Bdellovibrionales bacterium]
MKNTKSNWNDYYSRKEFKVPDFILNAIWRNFKALLCRHLKSSQPLVVIELGGANSYFYKKIRNEFNIKEYHIVDNNMVGLNLFPHKSDPGVVIHNLDLLDKDFLKKIHFSADLVFSFGLIEHFLPAETKKLTELHFKLTKLDGLVFMSFPTPTLIYKGFRKFLEITHRFPPLFERPIQIREIEDLITSQGTKLEIFRVWSTILTQFFTLTKNDLAENLESEKNNTAA